MKPILTAHLLPIVEAHLLELLRSLRPSEWELQTVAPAWKVKDVAAHLLDTQLRKLSLVRDGYAAGPPPRFASRDDFLAFINRLNREGVEMYRRLSPAVLISMMEIASRESAEFHQSLDPMAQAVFSVSWAGEETSLNWFDTARELTERWHHQQQIRLATNRPGIMTRELYDPVLDCFMRALPFTYRDKPAEPERPAFQRVRRLRRKLVSLSRWRSLGPGRVAAGTAASETTIPQEIAWRLFTKGIDWEAASAQVSVSGDRDLDHMC